MTQHSPAYHDTECFPFSLYCSTLIARKRYPVLILAVCIFTLDCLSFTEFGIFMHSDLAMVLSLWVLISVF